jgi:hypothetical protein
MINVKEPGGSFAPAKGDGCTDDTAALQALIDAALGALCFPEGRYVISETLVFPPKTGQHIVGSGMSEKLPISSDGRGAECALVWNGLVGGTMVEYQGEGLVWNGLLVGHEPRRRLFVVLFLPRDGRPRGDWAPHQKTIRRKQQFSTNACGGGQTLDSLALGGRLPARRVYVGRPEQHRQ